MGPARRTVDGSTLYIAYGDSDWIEVYWEQAGMEARLAAITAESDAKAKGDQYRAVLEDIIASGQQDQAIAFIDHGVMGGIPWLSHPGMHACYSRTNNPRCTHPEHLLPVAVLSDSVPLLLSRQLLSLLASSISRLPSDCQEDVARQ